MSLISVTSLTAGFGDRILFENAEFEIEKNDIIGVIGSNGVGKTTLFRIITGECESISGQVTKQRSVVVGYMQQHACDGSELCVLDEALTVFNEIFDIEKRLDIISRQINQGAGDTSRLIEEQIYLNEKYQSLGGLTYLSKTKSALRGLGFSQKDFNLPVKNLSGGQRSKLSLCKLLLKSAHLLLLDEPTNHLDIESVQWLEEFIKDFNGAAMIISHDRYFLDRVTNKTLEIENKKTTICKGNYSRFAQLKQQHEQSVRNNYENTMAQVHRIEGIIAQQRQFNREKNIRTAESKQKMIDRMTKNLEKPQETQEEINFSFSVSKQSGNDVIFCENLSKSFGEKNLFKNVCLDIKRGDRVFLLGPNGSGKTTLLKILNLSEQPDSGYFHFGANVKTGYFDQTLKGLNTDKTALDEVWDSNRDMTMTQIRSAMARFLFFSEDVYKKMSLLSGGEKAKIALLKLMLGESNFLLLDEPTNHLDINSREALEKALENYDGTLLVVSHDRYFINKIAKTIIRIGEHGAEKFTGGYEDYCNKISEKEEKNIPAVQGKPKNSEYKMKKERESTKRKLKTKIIRTEQEIEENEKAIFEIQQMLLSDENASDYEVITKLTSELASLKEKGDELISVWEELSEEIAMYD